MPIGCWLALYALLCWTVGWRLAVWVTGAPKPADIQDGVACAIFWLVFPIVVPFGVVALMLTVIRHIPIWIAYGGRE